MRKAVIIITLILTSLRLSAQEGPLVFNSKTWDFGNVDDNEGILVHDYEFINKSGKAVKIGSVSLSCSCIEASYPHGEIAAGERGSIELSFFPAGAIGQVLRSMEVFDSEGNHLASLSMSAEVNRVDSSLEDLYHLNLSETLAVDRIDVPFGYMYHGQSLTKIVRLANFSEKTLSLKAVCEDPGSFFSVECPETIGPRSETEIFLSYRIPDDESLYGSCSDDILIFADGKKAHKPLTANCIYLSKPKKSAEVPQLWTNPSVSRLKKALLRESYSGSLELGNSGSGDLTILAVEGPAEISLKKGDVIPKGGKKRVTANSTKKEFTVELFTNDPVRPYKELIFKY